MSGKLPKLSEANLEIMKIVWSMKEVRVTDVLERINSNRKKKIGRTSVLVQLTRLRDYGWLKARKIGRTFYYSAKVNRDKATKEILFDIKDRVFNGSNSEMIRFLFKENEIKQSELDEIKAMIDNYDEEKK